MLNENEAISGSVMNKRGNYVNLMSKGPLYIYPFSTHIFKHLFYMMAICMYILCELSSFMHILRRGTSTKYLYEARMHVFLKHYACRSY